MSRDGGSPVGAIVVLAVALALGNVWLHPFARHGDGASGSLSSSAPVPDRLVRRTPGWTRFSRATLTPGIQTLTGANQCTTDFVFTDGAGQVYLGQAAHCSATSEPRGATGCTTPSRPLGTPVDFTAHTTQTDLGRRLGRGRLAYSSWLTMQRLGERNPNACRFNDFALVRVDPADRDEVNPTLPYWGGPTGLSRAAVLAGKHVYGYGRSSLRRASAAAYSRQAATTFPDSPEVGGWVHVVVARSPGIPGDSGSGYVDETGGALGTLETLSFGYVLTNDLGDLASELRYARRHSGIRGLRLELGTLPFHRGRAAAAVAPAP